MDKWTYRQLYRCAVGGNARARLHWKKCGVDPQEKIDTKYSSMTAHQYKTALEKDVADACRRGLTAIMGSTAATGGAGKKSPSPPADPFADYFNQLGASPAAPAPARASSTRNLAALPKVGAPGAASPAASPAASRLGAIPTSVSNPVSKSGSMTDVPAAGGTAKGPLGPLGALAAGLATTPTTTTAAATKTTTTAAATTTTPAVDVSDGAAAAPTPAALNLPAGLQGIKPKPGVRKAGGLSGAIKKAPPLAPTAAEPEQVDQPVEVSEPEPPSPAPVPPAPAPAPTVAVHAAPFHAAPPAAAPKPFKPLAPLPVASKPAAAAAKPVGGLSGAWAELEASTKAPAKKGPPTLCSFAPTKTTSSAPSVPPKPPVTTTPAAPAPAVAANGSSNGSTPAEAETTPVMTAPTNLFASQISAAKGAGSKKLGASRVTATPAAAAKADSFGDFDFGEDEASPEGKRPAGGGNGGNGAKAFNSSNDDWGWDGTSPQKPKEPEPEPVVDDPWADVGKGIGSSMFAYDCSSLHAATAPSSPPAQEASKPKPKKSLFDEPEPQSKDDSQGFGGFGAGGDPYQSLARDKFANATAISSSSFQAAAPPPALEAVDPAIKAAEEAAEKERRLQELGLSGASGFGSSDLEGPTSPGRVGRAADAARAVGGLAAGYAASLLSRASPRK